MNTTRHCKRCDTQHGDVCPDIKQAHAYAANKPNYIDAVGDFYGAKASCDCVINGEGCCSQCYLGPVTQSKL